MIRLSSKVDQKDLNIYFIESYSFFVHLYLFIGNVAHRREKGADQCLKLSLKSLKTIPMQMHLSSRRKNHPLIYVQKETSLFGRFFFKFYYLNLELTILEFRQN